MIVINNDCYRKNCYHVVNPCDYIKTLIFYCQDENSNSGIHTQWKSNKNYLNKKTFNKHRESKESMKIVVLKKNDNSFTEYESDLTIPCT